MTRRPSIQCAIWAGKWIGYRNESMRLARESWKKEDRARLVKTARSDNRTAVEALRMCSYYQEQGK